MRETADGAGGATAADGPERLDGLDGSDELVVRGAYLSGPRYRLHDGDVVRVRPGTAHLARWGDLVAARSPDGALAVGVLVPPPPGAGAEGPWVVSDWDGPLVRLCCCGRPYLLGLAEPLALRKAGNRYTPAVRGRTRPRLQTRVPVPYLRTARVPVRPER